MCADFVFLQLNWFGLYIISVCDIKLGKKGYISNEVRFIIPFIRYMYIVVGVFEVKCMIMPMHWGYMYSETSLIRPSMGPENNVGLGGCWIMECLLPYLCMVTVPHIMVGLERMLDDRGVELVRFHCNILSQNGYAYVWHGIYGMV